MGNAYELDGQLFTTVGEFLDAVSHEYKHGDTDLAVQTLEDYGFSATDINTGDHHPHPSAARSNAHAIPVADGEDDEEDEDLDDDKKDEEEE